MHPRYPFYSISRVKHDTHSSLGSDSTQNKSYICYRWSAGPVQLWEFFHSTQVPGLWSWMPCQWFEKQLKHQGSLKDGKMETVYSGNQDGNLAAHESEWKLRDLVYAKRKAKGNSWNNSFVWCFSVIYLFSWSVQFVFFKGIVILKCLNIFHNILTQN